MSDWHEIIPTHECTYFCRDGRHAELVYGSVPNECATIRAYFDRGIAVRGGSWRVRDVQPAPEALIPTVPLGHYDDQGRSLGTALTPPHYHAYLVIVEPISLQAVPHD